MAAEGPCSADGGGSGEGEGCSTSGRCGSGAKSRKRGKRNFSYEETAVLVGIWSEEEVQRRFENAARHLVLWREISQRMVSAGFSRDADECRNKINNLRAEYLRLKRNQHKSEFATTWPFWSKMDKVFRSKPIGNSHHHGDNTESQHSRSDSYPGLFSDKNSHQSYREDLQLGPKMELPSLASPGSSHQDDRMYLNPQQFLREKFPDIASSKDSMTNGFSPPPFKRPRYKKASKPPDIVPALNHLVELEQRGVDIMKQRVENEERMIAAAMHFFSCMAAFFKASQTWETTTAVAAAATAATTPSPVAAATASEQIRSPPAPSSSPMYPHSAHTHPHHHHPHHHHPHHHPPNNLSPPVQNSPPAWADPGF